jgi:hypothetical protein
MAASNVNRVLQRIDTGKLSSSMKANHDAVTGGMRLAANMEIFVFTKSMKMALAVTVE